MCVFKHKHKCVLAYEWVHMCWCVCLGWRGSKADYECVCLGGGGRRGWVQKWLLGMQVRHAHPSLSFLSFSPHLSELSLRMSVSGFQRKWLRNIAGSNHWVTVHRGPVCVRWDGFYVAKKCPLVGALNYLQSDSAVRLCHSNLRWINHVSGRLHGSVWMVRHYQLSAVTCEKWYQHLFTSCQVIIMTPPHGRASKLKTWS